MKVSVYKVLGGGFSILAQAAPGKGRPPVLLQGITPGNVSAKTLQVVTQMRRPRGEQMELAGLQ